MLRPSQRCAHKRMPPSPRPSIPLPPRSAVADAARDIVRRRLTHSEFFGDIVQTAPEKVQQYLEWNDDYALLALYPPSEVMNLERRLKRFGQGFPGLFNIDGKPRPHDVRPGARKIAGFLGGGKLTASGVLIVSDPLFKAVLHGNCALRVERDASATICSFRLKSGVGAAKRFRYTIYFVYIVAFGDRFSPFNFLQYFESNLVMNFGITSDSSQRRTISGERSIEGLMV